MAWRSTLKTLFTVAVTAVATSAFWIAAYNAGDDEPAGAQGSSGGQLELGPTGLAIPVEGISRQNLLDTYKQARAGGERVHDAIDIMAPRGTPVIAAAPGTVEKLFLSKGGGGITAYIRSLDGKWSYYYAHLDRYAPGLAEGQRVDRGKLLGWVGFSGNANPEGPHLHFAINRMGDGERWWQGRPINPYPLLAGER